MIGNTMIDDLSKYKRLFTVGCSFTEYFYPTWATIMHKSMPDAEYYNLGLSGCSNPFIANRLAEANRKFNFCETDLVIVMWTTTCRETHYVNGTWLNPGNIYSQNVYPKEFVEKFADPVGYLIRDMATIELATRYMNSLSCKYIGLLSTPIDFMYLGDHSRANNPVKMEEILDVYKDLLDTFPKSMLELELDGEWPTELSYIPHNGTEPRIDYHPTPERYCQYLIKLGFPLTESAIEYADRTTKLIKTFKTRHEFADKLPEFHHYKAKGIW